MLALIFAVISLSSIDPDPIVTPAPQIHDRVTAGTGFAPGGPVPASGFTSDITVAPACTFGVPQFGTSFWNDAASLARFSEPACAGLGASAPGLPAFSNGFVRLAPARLDTPRLAPARLGSMPVFRLRAGAEPIFARAAAGAPRVTQRRH